MSTVFIGGSRHISRLSAEAKERLHNIVSSGFQVVVGDANGADKAVQKYMLDVAYAHVTVFCAGDQPRNNLGQWDVRSVTPPRAAKGFQFYATKDREMASTADFGLMIWDGKSPGTALNILRLVRAGKKAVLLNVPAKRADTFRISSDWTNFLAHCTDQFQHDLRERATADEWALPEPQQVLFTNPENDGQQSEATVSSARSHDDMTADINSAFASGDMASVVNLLGSFAKARGMGTVAKEAGLSRESLYRSLRADGNPEFSTILKVMGSLGLRLTVNKLTDDQFATIGSSSKTMPAAPF